MNKINNSVFTNSTGEKSTKNISLPLNRSRATLAKNHASSKNSRQSVQRNYTPAKKKKEQPEYYNLTFSELARPNLRRINSILEKQKIKSKFDMMKAEKFVKMLQEPVTTPREFKKHLENRNNRKKEEIRKKQIIDKTVDDLCKKLKDSNFGKISFTEYQKNSTKKLLEKLAICSDNESSEDESAPIDHATSNFSFYKPPNFDNFLCPNRFVWNPGKCLPIDDFVLKEPQNFSYGKNSTQQESKTDNEENASITPEIRKFDSLNIGNSTKKSNDGNFSVKIQEKDNFHKSPETVEDFYITIPQDPPQNHEQFSKDETQNSKISSLKKNRATAKLILDEFSSNRPNLMPSSSNSATPQPHQPSFARNFPVSTPQKKNDKILGKISDDRVRPNWSNSSILTDKSENSNASKFDTFVQHLATEQTSQKQPLPPNKVIALRELTDEDLTLKTDSEIMVRVTKQDFSKTYIIKKLENVEKFQDFCKCSISKRSKLFKMTNEKVDSSILIKQLPENNSQMAVKLSNKNEETFSVQKIIKAIDENIQFDTFAFDIEVKKDPLDDSNFIVRKK